MQGDGTPEQSPLTRRDQRPQVLAWLVHDINVVDAHTDRLTLRTRLSPYKAPTHCARTLDKMSATAQLNAPVLTIPPTGKWSWTYQGTSSRMSKSKTAAITEICLPKLFAYSNYLLQNQR